MSLRRTWVSVVALALAAGGAAALPTAAAAVPTCQSSPATIVGTAGDDTITGTPRADVIVGLGGNDRINARAGNDVVCGGPGNDRVVGGDGKDFIAGDDGDDRIRGGLRADSLQGGIGNDRVDGRAGPDAIDGGAGLDLCRNPTPPKATTCENTTQVSVDYQFGFANGYDQAWRGAVISDDGRYVAFTGRSSPSGDEDYGGQVFVRDRVTGTTELVSVALTGGFAEAPTGSPVISTDGRYVLFVSPAMDLIPGEVHYGVDVFQRDLQTQVTSRVVKGPDDFEWGYFHSLAMSADNRYLTFASDAADVVDGDTNDVDDIFVFDRDTATPTRVSVGTDQAQGNDRSVDPAISGDGRYVVFTSWASNLVPGDTNDRADVFVHDMLTGKTSRVSVPTDGGQIAKGSTAPSISADGRYVAFMSSGRQLVPGDTNGQTDVFVHDLKTGKTTRVSVTSHGDQVNSDSQLSRGSLSADGRFVVFCSTAAHLVAHDTNGLPDVFVHDRRTGFTRRVSVAINGDQANGTSTNPMVSADGRQVLFRSVATNLVPEDTNRVEDLFVRIIR